MPTLADVVANRTNTTPATPALATRPLTGKERHPLILLSGGYKVGKSWAIAAACALPKWVVAYSIWIAQPTPQRSRPKLGPQ